MVEAVLETFKCGEEVAVIGVEFVGQSEIAGGYPVARGDLFFVEFGAGDVLGLRVDFCGQEFFHDG